MAQGFEVYRVPDLDVDVEVALRKSADDFKGLLNDIHVDKIEKTTFSDVCRSLSAIQFQQQEKKTLMNLNRIELFLSGMHSLQDVLRGRGMEDVEGIMAFIWGPMRFLLETTNVNDKAFDHILDVYQRLGIQILPLDEYKQFFAESVNGRICLLNIYKDVAEFHKTAYRLFSLRSSLWGKLCKATWKDLGSTFDHLAASLKLHADFIRTHGDRYALRVDSGFESPQNNALFNNNDFRRKSHEYMDRCRQQWKDFRDKETARKRKQKGKVLNWIAVPKTLENLHKSFVEKREPYPETGRWLYTRYDEVSNWMREDIPQDSALWVHGKRGMGKTVLSSLVVTRLEELIRTKSIPSDVQICYFYCRDDDPELNTYFGILRGIIHQLVSAVSVLSHDPDEVNDEEDEGPDHCSNNNGFILPLCDDKISSSGGSTLSTAEGCLSLIEAFFEIHPRLYIVVDGLDECTGRVEIHQAVSFLVSQVSRLDEINQGQLRVLFMSQQAPDVKSAMTKPTVSPIIGEVELKDNDNTQDIRTYVRSRMSPAELAKTRRTVRGRINPREELIVPGDNFNLFEREIQRIEEEVSMQSEGLFLYAVLAADYLSNQFTKGDLLQKVKSRMLPVGIAKMYDDLLGTLKEKMLDLSEAHWEKAKLLLGWLACAHRPLKWHEIQAIIAFDLVENEINFDLRMIRRDNINDFLGSLVEVLPGDEIRLMHSTVKQHLVGSRHIHSKSVQCDLAILCLRYLSLPCFTDEEYTPAERYEQIQLGYFSFQDYAVPKWYKHLETVIEDCHDIFAPDFYVDAEQGRRRNFVHDFNDALHRFTQAYDADLRSLTDIHQEFTHEHLSNFINLPFYTNLVRLWNHIYTHQKESVDDRNKAGIKRLQDAFLSHRTVLEEEYKPTTIMCGQDTIETYYGPNQFKCERTLCKFFYEGFKTKKDRDSHHNRHNRPYSCRLETCSAAPFGFSSNKDMERHMRTYHPDDSEGQTPFIQMSRRVEQAKFPCNICGKCFTRNINLKGHMRSHFGERPFACSNCGKAFARLNDCRRHERIHTRKGS
ncbi:hypothetical protein BDP81DRAFT_396093 [Colletotrichum phormii]|uniref:C2H2-type domain-containing protein n=1 Tax=Colletotrichum phormii TaxID=359342 RepID=A0AAI9ZQG2_9PEZI|nr:uncharacterized protein BDP81DRAFT_396093 [Colletotrichum phormii]KAK1634847.1 hypothetical protein BDP81DRAFT_396093 [Colletotrichum phormii]